MSQQVKVYRMLDLSPAALVPFTSRLYPVMRLGDRTTAATVKMTASAGAQHLDPVQFNLNITGANPSESSTINTIYQKITHETTDMSYLRLKCADWNVVVGKDILDAYVFQGEIDFGAAGIAVGGEACVIGLVLDAGADTVTCSAWRGINITMRGAGTPAASQAIFIHAADGITVREAIWIAGYGITSAIRLGPPDTYTSGPTNLLALPTAGYPPVSAHTGVANGGTVVKIRCLVGATAYYILASTTPA